MTGSAECLAPQLVPRAIIRRIGSNSVARWEVPIIPLQVTLAAWFSKVSSVATRLGTARDEREVV